MLLLQVSVNEVDAGRGVADGFGNLPSNGPLPPHLVVQADKGIISIKKNQD